ncbi:putative expansin-B2 [Vitis vinifera]|uniref:Putative expansin-B2 n=1 Tax=Vitis vinifera TaxID=29760 RepID=A0A438IKA5_VITVI|nr:putative expansin-B2 [Vitis vinifera]
MAILLHPHPFSLIILLSLFSLLLNPCSCSHRKHLNVSKLQSDTDWSPAGATWYGPAAGAGSDGGACGYGDAVEKAPFSAKVSAGGPSLFKSGKGCGACYQVKCTGNEACSGSPVTVTITDECPGCVSESTHFDLSGTAFGAMATPGQAINCAMPVSCRYNIEGILVLLCLHFNHLDSYLNKTADRVECEYPGASVAFHVDSGSNPNYFASLIEYEDGDGELAGVDLQQALHSNSWVPMQQSWGAVWKLDSGSGLRAPFSIRLTALESGNTLVAKNVIPAGWQPGKTYRSLVNFNA